jgi:hypothetical protein
MKIKRGDGRPQLSGAHVVEQFEGAVERDLDCLFSLNFNGKKEKLWLL